MIKKAKAGRPPKGDKAMMTPIAVRFPEPMRTEIERIQASRMDRPDLSAIIRELVAEALANRKNARARK